MQRSLANAALCIAVAASSPSYAAAPPEKPDLVEYGIGTLSCATWQSDPMAERTGEQWIFGYFTGSNVFNERDGLVGHETDQRGIVAEVKKVCDGKPSLLLMYATARVYFAMMNEKR